MKLKGIDGGPHKRWSMWFNSKQREEPYQVLTSFDHSRDRAFFGDKVTGGAWLSSARVVRCWVKSRNERNPIVSCHHLVGHSGETAGDKPEEGGDDVKSSCPYDLGYTCYNGKYNESLTARSCKSLKASLSSDCRLQLACMKPESLVIADQHAAVNTFPGLVHTARHTTRVCNTRSR